jgi:hypothetical protein
MIGFTFVHWLLFLFLGILALGSLVLAIRLFKVEYPIERRDQFRRSLKIGGLAAFFSFIVVLIIGTIVWAETGVMKSMVLASPILCLIPFVFAISAIGTYVQFFWYEKLNKYREGILQRQIERFESHNQNPPAK